MIKQVFALLSVVSYSASLLFKKHKIGNGLQRKIRDFVGPPHLVNITLIDYEGLHRKFETHRETQDFSPSTKVGELPARYQTILQHYRGFNKNVTLREIVPLRIDFGGNLDKTEFIVSKN